MRNLRAYVKSIGGAVHAVHPAVHAMTVQVKASNVAALAQRSDVVSVSPNRETQRTLSTLETITGALTSNVRTESTKTSYTGLGGTGVGIAVLDSGVMREHWAFADATAGYRVKRNVNMLNASLSLARVCSSSACSRWSTCLRPRLPRTPWTRSRPTRCWRRRTTSSKAAPPSRARCSSASSCASLPSTRC